MIGLGKERSGQGPDLKYVRRGIISFERQERRLDRVVKTIVGILVAGGLAVAGFEAISSLVPQDLDDKVVLTPTPIGKVSEFRWEARELRGDMGISLMTLSLGSQRWLVTNSQDIPNLGST